ncbi:retrovirus-related pol polyprotein from transposon TNT 1-94, partial [Tanacetum coccineum]
NHDVCVLNYVNDMNSRGKKQKVNVSKIENQKKQKPKDMKPKKVGSNERNASPKPSKPRSESLSDYSKGYPNLFMVRRLGLFQAYDRESKASHQFRLEVFGNYLEVAFRRNTCFVRNLEGVDLLKGNRTTNLYTINLHEMASASPICLMARATSTKSWLWHQRLSHLNFDTINDLAKNDLVTGLPKFKYHKEHLCPSCESKDETPKVIKTFLKRIIVLLQSPIIIIRTDNGTKFKNQILKEYFDSVGISHQTSSVRTPQQNRVVERRNRTLVEAARTMLIFSHALLFLWAEAIATACYTQNRSIIYRRFNKTPYELINGGKPDISFLHVFGALCYPKNDRGDIG